MPDKKKKKPFVRSVYWLEERMKRAVTVEAKKRSKNLSRFVSESEVMRDWITRIIE